MNDGAGDPDDIPETTEPENTLKRLFRNGRTNALLGWLLVAVLTAVFVESMFDIDYQWILFVAIVGLVVLIPSLAFRDWRVMPPWELLVLALLPILVRGLVRGTVGTFATHLALAALALLVIVELHMFTSMEVTHWFAVVLVVLATLAAAAAWTIFRWNADRLLGTDFLVDNETLMIEWLYVTLAGLAAGVLFDGYFRRRDRLLWNAIRRMVRR